MNKEIEKSIQEIVELLTKCAAVLPLTIWTSSFRQRKVNNEWGSIIASQRFTRENYRDAALEFISITEVGGDEELQIVEAAKIVDANNRVVYQRVTLKN